MKYADMCDKIREHIDDIQKFEDEFRSVLCFIR